MLKTMVTTFILAISFSFAAHASYAEEENIETKLQAQALMLSSFMQQEAATLMEQIAKATDEVGTSMEDSGGYLKALGENETAALKAKKKIDALLKTMEKSNRSEEIFLGRDKVEILTKELRKLARNSKALIEKLRKPVSIQE
ncbi:MAG: hypothetical protein ACXWRE_06265 [Pseudobdellovibrionaceae bacterium]